MAVFLHPSYEILLLPLSPGSHHPHQTPSLCPFRANLVRTQIQIHQSRVLPEAFGQGLTGEIWWTPSPALLIKLWVFSVLPSFSRICQAIEPRDEWWNIIGHKVQHYGFWMVLVWYVNMTSLNNEFAHRQFLRDMLNLPATSNQQNRDASVHMLNQSNWQESREHIEDLRSRCDLNDKLATFIINKGSLCIPFTSFQHIIIFIDFTFKWLYLDPPMPLFCLPPSPNTKPLPLQGRCCCSANSSLSEWSSVGGLQPRPDRRKLMDIESSSWIDQTLGLLSVLPSSTISPAEGWGTKHKNMKHQTSWNAVWCFRSSVTSTFPSMYLGLTQVYTSTGSHEPTSLPWQWDPHSGPPGFSKSSGSSSQQGTPPEPCKATEILFERLPTIKAHGNIQKKSGEDPEKHVIQGQKPCLHNPVFKLLGLSE